MKLEMRERVKSIANAECMIDRTLNVSGGSGSSVKHGLTFYAFHRSLCCWRCFVCRNVLQSKEVLETGLSQGTVF